MELFSSFPVPWHSQVPFAFIIIVLITSLKPHEDSYRAIFLLCNRILTGCGFDLESVFLLLREWGASLALITMQDLRALLSLPAVFT